MQVICS